MKKILTHTIIENKKIREKKLFLQTEMIFQFILKIKKRGLIHG